MLVIKGSPCYNKIIILIELIIITLSIGTVIRTGAVKLLETEREYICSRCKQSFTMDADFEQYYAIPKPARLGSFY